MSDYADSINSLDYQYKAKVYIQELGGIYQTDVLVNMVLDENNFNFDLAQENGNDFRLAEQSNGGGVFKMWLSVWDSSNKYASIWFKIPTMFAGQMLELTAFWGNPNTNSISDSSILDAIFMYEFDSSPLDSTVWTGNDPSVLTQSWNDYGYRLRFGNTNWYMETIATPLTGMTEWILEAGLFTNNAGYSSSSRSFRIVFQGTENPFDIYYYGERNSYGIRTNIQYGDTTYQDIPYCNGLEVDDDNNNNYTYNQLYVAYKESVDRVYMKLTDRPTLDDYSGNLERRVEDETKLTNLRIYGYDYAGEGGPHPWFNWILVRNYADDANVSDFDLSNLYREHDDVDHQIIDHEEYGEDITNIGFEHKASSGDPYRLSDNIEDSTMGSWITDSTSSTAWATINFGGGNDLTDETFRHYDSGHVRYLNASKLSNDSDDVNDNNYWQCTTASGYACIDFGSNNNKAVSGLAIQAVPGALDNLPKDFVFQASNSDPRLSEEDRWVTLDENNFEYTEDKQYFFFSNDSNYRYYKLKVLNTFTGEDIKLYTWHMYEHVIEAGKKVVSKLRLLPLVGPYENNFPNYISFYGSNDGIAWSLLIGGSDTDYGSELTDVSFTIGQENPLYTGGAFDGILTDGDATGSWYAYYSSDYQNDGWIGQDFGSGNEKAVTRYRLYSSDISYAPRDWTFEASTTGAWSGEEVVLHSVINYNFTALNEWHNFSFSNTNAYRYYRINVSDNNGNNDYLVIREIEMYELSSYDHPTYTPFDDFGGSRWQEYSFENIIPYYMYKLVCGSNWGADNDSIVIAEWSMHEKASEQYTHRILAGGSNNFNSVWLLDNSTFDDISFLAANNVLNMVSNDTLVYYESFSGDISGRGAPTPGVGSYGDQYLDVNTGSLYVKDVPIYSIDKTGAGTATASHYYTTDVPEKAFDDDYDTRFWNYTYPIEEIQWLQYDFGVGNEEIINQMTYVYEYGNRLVDCTIKASNDETTWVTLHTETNMLQIDEARPYSFANENAYRYYRVYGDRTHQTGHGLYAFGVSEMEFKTLVYYDWRLISTGSNINDVNAI